MTAPRAGKSRLYSAAKPYRAGYLKVDDVHRIYFEESGNPQGKPAVVLHGGPGAGLDPAVRGFFNPKKYRLVLFDQRGCGRSRPRASLVNNTTWHLVDDIEALRRELGIGKWLVFGGSWGSTLALAYAQSHPTRVTELILRAVFLCRRAELEWFYQDPNGAAFLYPDLWREYTAPIPKRERADMIGAYYRRLTSQDTATRLRAGRAWSLWEAQTSYLIPNSRYISKLRAGTYATTFARIECHYFLNRAFFRTDNQLLDSVTKLRKIPGVIVQGRYDIVCPMRSAWDLHTAWKGSQLRVVANAGHSAFEPGMVRELVQATDSFAYAPVRS